jgi:hypothetical protein
MADISPFHVLNAQANHEDVQRNWMWQLEIPMLNTIVKDVDSEGLKTRIKDASIPGSDIDVMEIKYMGGSQFFPGMRKPSTEFTSNFVETEDHYVYAAIHGWMSLMQQTDDRLTNAGASLMASKSNGYGLTVFLKLFTYDAVLSRTFEFVGCWPKSLGQVGLSYDSSGLVEYAVGWKYDNYHIVA